MLRKRGKLAKQAAKQFANRQQSRIGNSNARYEAKGAASGGSEFLASMKAGWTTNHYFNNYPKHQFMKSHSGHLRPKRVG